VLDDKELSFKVEYCETGNKQTLSQKNAVVIGCFAILLLLNLIGTFIDSARNNGEEIQIRASKWKTIAADILVCFSLRSNWNSLTENGETRSGATLNGVDAIRALSAVWVILIHTHDAFVMERTPNKFLSEINGTFMGEVLLSGMATETFFLLSGLLMSTSMINQLTRNEGKINILMIIFKRWLRLGPVLWFVMAFRMVMPILGDGPLWTWYLGEGRNWSCDSTSWLLNLLMIDNSFPDYQCLVDGWFVMVDFQLFLLSLPCIVLIHWYV
jgi:hypothetical protein